MIITDDDCDITWLQLGMPIVIEKQLLTTAFCITVDGTGPSASMYVQQRSHTHNMHSAGANGQGRIVNWTIPEIVADMETSAEVLGGVKQVMAYPFGHHNDNAKEALREAGFEMARTIEPGLRHRRHRQAGHADHPHQLRHGAGLAGRPDRLTRRAVGRRG